jgi:hypothetical protein
MTIECPRCGTLYRRPPRGAGADATYRCARCRHVFAAGSDEPAIIGHDAPDDDEPRFTLAQDDDDHDVEIAAPDAARAQRPRPESRGGGTARFALRSMILVTLAYAVVSIYLYTHPRAAGDALRGVPLIGARLAESRLAPTAVHLTGVHGQYERVQGDRLVFVIAGTAVNDAPMPVRSVQVEGRIVGGQEQRQVVFCGAAPRDVHDLSLREIALLQTLEPPRDWTLGPGEQASFLIVFSAPPPDLREFTAEVVAVQVPLRRTGAA